MNKYLLIITMHADPAMPPGYGECGGTQTYMRELLDAFGEKGVSCILITRKSMSYLPEEEQYNNCCKIYRLINGSEEDNNKLNLYKFHQENCNAILEILNRQTSLPTVIHSVYWNSGRIAMELSNTLHIPFVHSVISNSRGRVSRGADEPMPQRAYFEQQIYENASKILCVSEDEKNDLLKFYHIQQDKIIVCGQFVDPVFFMPSHDSNGYPHINSRISEETQELIADKYNETFTFHSCKDHYWLYKAFTYFGRMDFNKGILLILQAWYKLYKNYNELCPPLWMAGGSLPEIETARNKIKDFIPELNELEQSYKLVWWGYLTTQGLSTILLKTQVVIMHSLYEPGGRVAVEAMSEKIPVIATPYGFAKDYIRDWKNGFLVPYGDLAALSQRMEHFIRQPLLSNALGEYAKESAKQIIHNWNFLSNHLKAYGILELEIPISKAQSITDYYEYRYINIFPYCVMKINDEYIQQAFSVFSDESILSIQNFENEKDILYEKCLITAQNNYYVLRMITRLSREPLFNPFARQQITHDAHKHFITAKNIYTRFGIGILAGIDMVHSLLFIRNFKKLDWSDSEKFSLYFNTFIYRPNLLTFKEQKQFYATTNRDFKSRNDIDALFESLNETFFEFDFPFSGKFSCTISWKIAVYLLELNQHLIDNNTYWYLREVAYFFNKSSNKDEQTQLRDINLSAGKEQLALVNDAIIFFKAEKTSIGTIEIEAATFIYDYFDKFVAEDLSSSWEKLIFPKIVAVGLNSAKILSSLSYCIFYDIIRIYTCSLQERPPQQYIENLRAVKSKMEILQYASSSDGSAPR